MTTEEGGSDCQGDQMTITQPDGVPPHAQKEEVITTGEEHFLSQNQTKSCKISPKQSEGVTDENQSKEYNATEKHSVLSESANTSGTENLFPNEKASTPPRLKLSVLKNEMKLKPHVKARGRPKHTGTIWPSKSKTKSGKRKKVHSSMEKENLPPNKKVCLDNKLTSDAKGNRIKPGNPAYLIKMRKKHAIDSKSENDVMEIDLSECESSDDKEMESPEFIINGQNIYSGDIQILKTDHEWLNERLINAGQRMLLKKFPSTAGLNDICFCDTLAFPCDPPKDVVQILNVTNAHWICISNRDCKPGNVKVYDSLRSGDLPMSVKEVIAALIKCDKKKIFLIFPEVQQQPDSSSCGLFALAYAATLCEGKDPTKTKYDFPCMRTHFLNCLQKKKFISFPSTSSMYLPSKPLMTSFKIYCICRLPDRGDKMVFCDRCKEWYHFVCIGLDLDSDLDDTWLCTNCST